MKAAGFFFTYYKENGLLRILHSNDILALLTNEALSFQNWTNLPAHKLTSIITSLSSYNIPVCTYKEAPTLPTTKSIFEKAAGRSQGFFENYLLLEILWEISLLNIEIFPLLRRSPAPATAGTFVILLVHRTTRKENLVIGTSKKNRERLLVSDS